MDRAEFQLSGPKSGPCDLCGRIVPTVLVEVEKGDRLPWWAVCYACMARAERIRDGREAAPVGPPGDSSEGH